MGPVIAIAKPQFMSNLYKNSLNDKLRFKHTHKIMNP